MYEKSFLFHHVSLQMVLKQCIDVECKDKWLSLHEIVQSCWVDNSGKTRFEEPVKTEDRYRFIFVLSIYLILIFIGVVAFEF